MRAITDAQAFLLCAGVFVASVIGALVCWFLDEWRKSE